MGTLRKKILALQARNASVVAARGYGTAGKCMQPQQGSAPPPSSWERETAELMQAAAWGALRMGQGGLPEINDCLALEYMTLPAPSRRGLLREVLRRRRRAWVQRQEVEKRRHARQVETHRAINVDDVRKMLGSSLTAEDLERRTIVRFERQPCMMLLGLARDLDWAIDSAIPLCVWD